MTQARFCLDRAERYVDNAAWASGWDTALLAAAGVSATTGVSLSAAAAAMDDGGTRTDVQIAGAVVTTVAAGLIAGRGALDLRETARVERTQAARNVQAALRGIELYALADDPASVANDAFAPCVASEEAVANALPGSDASPLDAYLKAEAQERDKAAAQRAKQLEATQAETAATQADVGAAKDEVTAKRAVVAALEATKRNAEEDAELKALKQKLADAEAKLAAAEKKLQKTKCELEVLSAQSRLDDAKRAVVAALGRYRRALLFVGKEEATQLRPLLELELAELSAASAALTSARGRECPAANP